MLRIWNIQAGRSARHFLTPLGVYIRHEPSMTRKEEAQNRLENNGNQGEVLHKTAGSEPLYIPELRKFNSQPSVWLSLSTVSISGDTRRDHNG